MSTEILMPALSPTMSEGKLSKWLVKEGDKIKAGDLLAEIETDKAIMEFESSEDGTLKKILINEGVENIKVSEPIALLETSNSLMKDSSLIAFSYAFSTSKINGIKVSATNLPP